MSENLPTHEIVAALLKAQKDYPDGELMIDNDNCSFSYPEATEDDIDWIAVVRCHPSDLLEALLDHSNINGHPA